MKILYLHATIPNYVTDALFHGLRSLAGITVVDVPRMDYMYEDASAEALARTGSRGNSLYKLLREINEWKGKRTLWQIDVDEYDYVIITDIHEQCDLFHNLYKKIHPRRRNSLCIVDGYDMTSMFPFFNRSFNLKVRPWSYFYNIRKVNYFKREYESVSALYGLSNKKYPFVAALCGKFLKIPVRLFPISMSIPEELIEMIPIRDKVQDFVNYNVDKDLSCLFPGKEPAELGQWKPAFDSAEEYYKDIRRSRFGITTRRAGWDCLRHYEYAAKGAILCFRDLEKKHPLCAPFGLDKSNCIGYHSKEDLLNKLKNKSLQEIEHIQEEQYKWINQYTTKKVALRFLEQLQAVQGASLK